MGVLHDDLRCKCGMEVNPRQLHEGEHRLGFEDDLRHPPFEGVPAVEVVFVVLDQHLKPILDESGDIERFDHLPD